MRAAGAAPASSSDGGHLHEADEAQSIEGSRQQIVQQIVEVSEQLRSLAMKHPLEVKQAALKQRMGTSIQPLVDALAIKWNYLWSTCFVVAGKLNMLMDTSIDDLQQELKVIHESCLSDFDILVEPYRGELVLAEAVSDQGKYLAASGFFKKYFCKLLDLFSSWVSFWCIIRMESEHVPPCDSASFLALLRKVFETLSLRHC